MTVLLILESLEFASFGLCSGPEFHGYDESFNFILAEVFQNLQSVILKIFPDRFKLRNAIEN